MCSLAKSFNYLRNSNRVLGLFPRLYSSNTPQYETLAVSVPKKYVYHVELNRPNKFNTFTPTMWKELITCFSALSDNPECRVVILSGQGKHFTGGIDLNGFVENASKAHELSDVARKARYLYKMIEHYQDGITALENCVKPVLAVVHSACVGAGVDLITAADVRYCTEEAWFQVKEVDVGLAADVGTLQRLPKVIGNTSIARELCYTARKLPAKEALDIGLVSKVFPDRDSAIQQVLEVAQTIASKSPVAVQVTKQSLVYSQSRPTSEGLEHIRLINQTMLQSDDLTKAAISQATKTEAEFDDL
ncbi:delta(3,5)-Delta(2,4)-dienoyl-CoA isomerase, mitochondrial [Papilio machaon]|uniref:delta(3,5)-Delta(2,4)-dienoyl-CoA isomerase, mitochondrial n=1 Tax=Papilio machaon TaxID=76193 RepID=UPI001E662F60|nr:delta(3,5)-Delta(2,4)-dienoyl-CoA isomerase, mitochondrial [Papilio machaon]